MTTESEQARLIEELRAAIQARDEFLAIAAHELRSPMHAVLLQIDAALALARRSADAELLQRLERVKLVLDRYVRRATMLLEVSRINAEHMDLHFEQLDLAEILRETVDTYAVEADFHRIVVDVSAPATLPGRGDRLAIEQVMANLISNAIKYGDGKPVQITLSRDEREITLQVTDLGLGISAEHQRRIFGRFEQVVTGRPRSGFGIGLWLVRALIEAHGGSINVRSAPGVGSTFTVRLPVETVRKNQEDV